MYVIRDCSEILYCIFSSFFSFILPINAQLKQRTFPSLESHPMDERPSVFESSYEVHRAMDERPSGFESSHEVHRAMDERPSGLESSHVHEVHRAMNVREGINNFRSFYYFIAGFLFKVCQIA